MKQCLVLAVAKAVRKTPFANLQKQQLEMHLYVETLCALKFAASVRTMWEPEPELSGEASRVRTP